MRIRMLLPTALLFALAGCQGFQAAKGFETAVVEPRVDAVLTELVGRLCKLPPDIVVRQIERNSNLLEAMYLICPEYALIINRGAGIMAVRSVLRLPTPAAGRPVDPFGVPLPE